MSVECTIDRMAKKMLRDSLVAIYGLNYAQEHFERTWELSGTGYRAQAISALNAIRELGEGDLGMKVWQVMSADARCVSLQGTMHAFVDAAMAEYRGDFAPLTK